MQAGAPTTHLYLVPARITHLLAYAPWITDQCYAIAEMTRKVHIRDIYVMKCSGIETKLGNTCHISK
jgi:hypothetical protein